MWLGSRPGPRPATHLQTRAGPPTRGWSAASGGCSPPPSAPRRPRAAGPRTPGPGPGTWLSGCWVCQRLWPSHLHLQGTHGGAELDCEASAHAVGGRGAGAASEALATCFPGPPGERPAALKEGTALGGVGPTVRRAPAGCMAAHPPPRAETEHDALGPRLDPGRRPRTLQRSQVPRGQAWASRAQKLPEATGSGSDQRVMLSVPGPGYDTQTVTRNPGSWQAGPAGSPTHETEAGKRTLVPPPTGPRPSRGHARWPQQTRCPRTWRP